MKKFKQFLMEQISRTRMQLNPYTRESTLPPLYHWDRMERLSFANMEHPYHKAAEEIHSAWMSRNPRNDWNAAQHVPYQELPEAEQAKDIEHVETVEKLITTIPIPEAGPEAHREAVANAFGSIQHEKWRKGFDPEGTGKPRMKKVSDGGEVNINVPWEELHPEWKKENYEAGLVAHDVWHKHVR
jgi:hypothetical protein